MLSVDAAVRAALDASTRFPVIRVLALDSAGSVLASYAGSAQRITAGTVTYDRTREVRRTADNIAIANPDGALAPHAVGDHFFTGEWWAVERGVYVGGVAQYLRMFTGVVASYQAGMSGSLTLSGNDPLFLTQQPMGAVLNLDGGLTGSAAIREVLEPVLGDGSTWHLDDGGRTLGTPRSCLEGDDRLGLAMGIAKDLGLELFADRYGAPVLQPVPDPNALPTVASFQVSAAAANLMDLNRAGSALPYNEQIVIGSSPSGDTVRGQADITDLSSPIASARIGLRVAPIYQSAQVTNQDQANAVARNLLLSQALYQDGLTFPALEDPTLDEEDVVGVSEPVSGTNDRYWVTQVVHAIAAGTMAIAGQRVIPLWSDGIGSDRISP
jgi:hypothetical protein